MPADNIIFFDGYCNLCNGFIDFVMRNDKTATLKVASLQGTTAKELGIHKNPLDDPRSIVFLSKGKTYRHSEAVLRILSEMGGVWKISVFFFIFPAFIRNALYSLVARKRYAWFGKRDTCRTSGESERARFLN
jgi:predicted DCC family thiol-disulfide oxidoreductase YuxK